MSVTLKAKPRKCDFTYLHNPLALAGRAAGLEWRGWGRKVAKAPRHRRRAARRSGRQLRPLPGARAAVAAGRLRRPPRLHPGHDVRRGRPPHLVGPAAQLLSRSLGSGADGFVPAQRARGGAPPQHPDAANRKCSVRYGGGRNLAAMDPRHLDRRGDHPCDGRAGERAAEPPGRADGARWTAERPGAAWRRRTASGRRPPPRRHGPRRLRPRARRRSGSTGRSRRRAGPRAASSRSARSSPPRAWRS